MSALDKLFGFITNIIRVKAAVKVQGGGKLFTMTLGLQGLVIVG